jgi:flagellar secretion chaperone FliS
MWKDAYLESRVLSANPLELICILYQCALDSVRDARRHLAAGDIVARSRAVCRGIGAISELDASLNHAEGGAISRNLAELYQYLRQRLTEANMRQNDAPLAEVESLLTTLSDAWKSVNVPPAPKSSTAQMGAEFPAAAWLQSDGGNAHLWSA